MNCLESQEMIQRRLDGEDLGNLPELEQHLSVCASCRNEHASAARLLEGLKVLPFPKAVPSLTDRIVESVLADRQARIVRARRRWRITVGLAAAVLLLAVVSYFGPSLPKKKPILDPGSIAKQPEPAPSEPKKEVTPPLQVSLEKAKDAVTSLSEQVAKKTRDQFRQWLAAAPLDVNPMPMPTMEILEEPLQPAAQSLLQASQGMAESLQAVTGSAKKAVDYFYQELPSISP